MKGCQIGQYLQAVWHFQQVTAVRICGLAWLDNDNRIFKILYYRDPWEPREAQWSFGSLRLPYNGWTEIWTPCPKSAKVHDVLQLSIPTLPPEASELANTPRTPSRAVDHLALVMELQALCWVLCEERHHGLQGQLLLEHQVLQAVQQLPRFSHLHPALTTSSPPTLPLPLFLQYHPQTLTSHQCQGVGATNNSMQSVNWSVMCLYCTSTSH